MRAKPRRERLPMRAKPLRERPPMRAKPRRERPQPKSIYVHDPTLTSFD